MKMMEDWDKIRKQIIEQPNLKDNGNFLKRLVMKIKR